MEVIVDELQKNGVNVDVTLLNIHVNRILCVYKTMYDEATSRLKTVDQLIDVFHENCFNTPAVVRVVVPSLKNIARVDGITSLKNAPTPYQIFIRTLCSSIGYTSMDTT